ncbi:hypothetical protein L2750_17445 [Shewanella submarina]|uniref:Lipoprotein n=1 Tax=Shewanella submarina TaxID=2016376 RepID=A0ABV7GBN3_9GAMM|nr:hypothetical protein [Shewanella submarina]MCL1038917.1 hypothetical protein [Shewanella submarina]
MDTGRLGFITLVVLFLSACANNTAELTAMKSRQHSDAAIEKLFESSAVEADVGEEDLSEAMGKLSNVDLTSFRPPVTVVWGNAEQLKSRYDSIQSLLDASMPYGVVMDVWLGEKAFKSLYSENWQICLEVTEEILALNEQSLTGHLMAAICHERQNSLDKVFVHGGKVYLGIENIWKEHRGLTALDAFQFSNAYDFLSFALAQRFEILDYQVLEHEKNHYLVRTSVKNLDDDVELTWFMKVAR